MESKRAASAFFDGSNETRVEIADRATTDLVRDGVDTRIERRGAAVRLPQRIPKRIHYCWLSGDEMPRLNRQCIESWKRFMPDYELVWWDMDRSKHLMAVEFVREACSVRAWAFAADYIRLHALFSEGGIYLDSDVEVFRPFDPFLRHSAFSSIEHWPSINGIGIEGAVLGAEKGHPWIAQCLEYYQNRRFLDENGERDETIVSGIIASLAAKGFGFSYKVERQELASGIYLYPPKVFTHVGGAYSPSETFALHHCSGGWRQERSLLSRLRARIRGVFS